MKKIRRTKTRSRARIFFNRKDYFCLFCKEKKDPDYKDYQTIGKFLTERGKIISKSRSGVCAKHGKILTRSIKHARYIGLLPFIVRPH